MNYIDLGLPSGTLWADANEEGFYTFDEAVEIYGDSLPTKEQFEELQTHCKWEWNGCGYEVTGPNGNTIVLPAAGYRFFDECVDYVGSNGLYWSSTPYGSDYTWTLYFYSGSVCMDYAYRCYVRSVRLIKKHER